MSGVSRNYACDIIINPVCILFASHEMAEQAEDLEDLYEKRLEIFRKSVKKESRKRRRIEEGILITKIVIACSVQNFASSTPCNMCTNDKYAACTCAHMCCACTYMQHVCSLQNLDMHILHVRVLVLRRYIL